jgi:nitrile hydratase accessory protein
MNGDAPVFEEPWEARAFAIAVALHERGVYTWPEWAAALGARIATSERLGDVDGDRYYHNWLGALEDILIAKRLASAGETARWRAAWRQAANRTPHGAPIELQPDDF